MCKSSFILTKVSRFFFFHSKCNRNGSYALLFYFFLFCQNKICGRLIYDMFPQNREGVCVKTVTVGGRVPQRGQAVMMYSSNIPASLPRTYPKHSALVHSFILNNLLELGMSGWQFSFYLPRLEDTWLVDIFTPALEMIKLLTLHGLSNHQASLLPDTQWITPSEKPLPRRGAPTPRFPPCCFKDTNRSRQNGRVLWNVFFTGEMLRVVFKLSATHTEIFLHS